MSDLEEAVNKRNQEWVKLEQTILALIKEHFRLSGRVYYEIVSPELETTIKGEG